MNQIATQEITATSATVNESPQEKRMLGFIQHHTEIYYKKNHFQEGIHAGYIQCIFDFWNEKEIFEISKEEFSELMIEEYFSLAGSGTLAKYKGYRLDEDIFPELGELPEPPRVNPEIRFDFEEDVNRVEEEFLPKFPKPGKTEKFPKRLTRKSFFNSSSLPVRDLPAYLEEVRELPCARCEFLENKLMEAVPAHYTGIRQHVLGKGMGLKVLDMFVAPFCDKCHRHFDEPKTRKSLELSEEFFFFISLTWVKVCLGGE